VSGALKTSVQCAMFWPMLAVIPNWPETGAGRSS